MLRELNELRVKASNISVLGGAKAWDIGLVASVNMGKEGKRL